MRVPGKNQAYAMPRGERNDARIVRQQDGGGIARNSAHRLPQVRAIAVIVDPGQIQGRAAKSERNMPVAQDFDVLPAQRQRDGLRIHAKIMIPQHREHPVARPQTAQDLRGRLDIRPGIGDEVSGQGHDIRIQPVGLPDRLGKPFLRKKQPMMNVGNLHDAQAAERIGEGIQPNPFVGHGEPVAGSPSRGACAGIVRRVLFDTPAAPANHPTRKSIALGSR